MTYDIAVIGAGPAGLAAAARAAGAGCRVVVLDAGPRPGGQYWRHRAGSAPADRRFRALAGALDRVDYRAEASVWFAEPGFTLHTGAGEVSAERLVLATGAHDRVVPFPGWDLPGVTTAGGAQALLKGHGVLTGRRIAVAGTGPFLLPVAAGLAAAGARIAGVFEAGNPLRVLRRPVPAAKLAEVAGYAARFARHRIRYRTGHVVVAAHGDVEVSAVTVAGRDGHTRRVRCDALAVGYGFVPALELPTLLGCAVCLDTDGNLVTAVDHTQQTSVPGVFAAGEVTGVGGADLALAEGAIAGAAAAASLGGRTPDDAVPAGPAGRRARLRRFAATLHAAHPVPAGWPDRLTADTVVCRCEEVPLRAVRAAVTELGATDARTVKSLTRAGMGWCQGRICGYPVACLAARLNGRPVAESDLDTFARRPIGSAITLGQLAEGDRTTP
ncbi:MAG TPA: NAD(P)/FAD-dependent oxidoreductase [Actinophytocola sp.]|uniref:FAD/NAD(P)-dependent oxidoreductase n=1 Tax=Actinophytocola sp. TaxID=1872138 RepID=UPI002DB7F8CA|nr:NAD(P)/FAD-dependent oxidoreductase [Actinophytocola sp.]HEU5470598.1 NAD(P)/FAD-dependent oxidoreductase [Actinophytocola sp.]